MKKTIGKSISTVKRLKLAGINEEIRVTTYKAMKPYIDIVDSIKWPK